MKEEKSILLDVTGSDQPKEESKQKKESKTKKYIRITLSWVMGAFFVALIVAAVMRKCGG